MIAAVDGAVFENGESLTMSDGGHEPLWLDEAKSLENADLVLSE